MGAKNERSLEVVMPVPGLDPGIDPAEFNAVIAGLDPAIHRLRKDSSRAEDGCAGQARA
jgi:hypothetical protein